MAETKIYYDKWINGKPYPMTYTLCDVCHERYIDPEDAINCESSPFEPKFKLSDRVVLKYDCPDYPEEGGIIIDIIPKPPRAKGCNHRVLYKVVFPGIGEDTFFERELCVKE